MITFEGHEEQIVKIGDPIQVTIDGVTYLTHATNVVFISY